MSKRSKARHDTIRDQMEGIMSSRSVMAHSSVRHKHSPARTSGLVFAIDACVGLITFAVVVITAGVAFGLI